MRVDLLGQVLVSSRDHAHIHVSRDVLADALVLALLQHAQELRLQVQGQIPDLIQKDCSSVGDLEAAGPVAQRAREGSAHVTEELAFEHLARNRTAVDSYEWSP